MQLPADPLVGTEPIEAAKECSQATITLLMCQLIAPENFSLGEIFYNAVKL